MITDELLTQWHRDVTIILNTHEVTAHPTTVVLSVRILMLIHELKIARDQVDRLAGLYTGDIDND